MLTETLRKFHRSQSGSPVFSLPSGKRVDLREKRSRQDLAKWIAEQFNGDLDAADDAVSSVMARALREARAPWPYLLSALRGIAEEADTREPLSRQCTNAMFSSRIGKCHYRIARNVLGDLTDPLTLSGREYNLSNSDDYSLAVQELLGDDPFPLFMATAPQFAKFITSRRLVDDLIQYRAITNDVSEAKEAQATFLGFVGQALAQCVLTNEFRECLKVIKSFYSRFFHPAILGVRVPGIGVMRCLSNAGYREFLHALFRHRQDHELLRSDWLRQALHLGIVTNPISWLVFILTRNVDTAEDWMDVQWYDTIKMTQEFGLRRVTELFPNLVAV